MQYKFDPAQRALLSLLLATGTGLTAFAAQAQRVSDLPPVQRAPTPQRQIPSQPPMRAPEPPAPPALPSSPIEVTAETISTIRVNGTERLESGTVLSYLPLRVGQQATTQDINAAVKALFATGLFEDAKIRMQGAELLVAVKENPAVNKVTFEGNSEVKTEDLEKEIQIKSRQVYTLPRLQRDVQRLQEIYRRSGRFAAIIEPKLVRQPQNRVDVIFEISEGERTGINSIHFIGNDNISDSTLRGIIATRESAWWRLLATADFYDPDRINFDRDLLRKFYLNEGYVDFRVVAANAELAPDQQGFFLTYTLDEGQRYKFGAIKLVSDVKGLDASLYNDQLLVSEGDWYSAEKIEQTVSKLTAAMDRLQFAFAEIVPEIERNKDNQTVAITFRIREGQRLFVSRIELQGNTRTHDKVIRREIAFAEGDAFNRARLERSEQRLRDLGYFEDAKITPVEGPQPDQTILQASVKEKATGELSFGAGYSTTDGPLGDFSIREKNFMGKGQDVRFGATLSGRTQQYDISFTEPYFLDRDLAAGVDLFRTTTDNQDSSSFDETNTGFALRLGFPLSEQLRQRLTYTFQNTNISSVPADASRFIREQEGVANTSMVGNELSYDTRDSRLNPTSGYVLRLNNDLAGLGGNVRFFRNRLKATQFVSIAEGWVISLEGEGGHMFGIGQKVRIADRFFLGGDSLRGFKFAGVGPRDLTIGGKEDALGGNRFVRGSAELTLPSGLPEEVGIKLHVFSDVGTLGGAQLSPQPNEDLRTDDYLRVSTGVGATWQSPFGPIRLDLARALRKQSYDQTETFRFSFGARF
jgi:outer membrane protein insertion porin family